MKMLFGFLFLVFISLLSPVAYSAEWILMSGMGAKCLDVEGGAIKQGARVIVYNCHGNTNQRFAVTNGGTIKIGGLCVDAAGGAGLDCDGLVLWAVMEVPTNNGVMKMAQIVSWAFKANVSI